jgi:chemotaxis protein CheX
MIEQMCLTDTMYDSAKEVFETMIFMDLQEAPDSQEQLQKESMIGTITFKGKIEGCLSVSCDTDCARVIAINMLGSAPTDEISTGEICDAIGEVTNMVMGSIKSRIEAQTGELQVSIPTVVMGRNLQNSLGEGASKVVVKVSTEDESLVVFSILYRGSAD